MYTVLDSVVWINENFKKLVNFFNKTLEDLIDLISLEA